MPNYAEDLKDYTDTVAAVHLLNEALQDGASIAVGDAMQIVAQENMQENPKIGDVIRQILNRANQEDARPLWKTIDAKRTLDAVITIGGAVYEVRFVDDGKDSLNTNNLFSVEIKSKLNHEGGSVRRGKLFFNPGQTATVQLVVNENGDINAVTKKGLSINATSFTPYPYQNESLAKFSESIGQGRKQRLAVMGTGSGKSIIMSGAAQAVGRCVMIVPDKTLVEQQKKEVISLLGEGIVNGTKKTPIVFTFDLLRKHFEFDYTNLSLIEVQQIQTYFRQVVAGTSEPPYDQILLQADDPLFKDIVGEIQNSMVLIDESHQHTFSDESSVNLQTITANNAVLALTATPTSKLYDLFPGPPVDELSLGVAIELGTIRPVKPEVSYLPETDLVSQAVLNYFNDYYITEGNYGYANPLDLVKQIKSNHPEIADDVAEKMAIDQAIELNRERAQRNMGFSDDPTIRERLASTYQKIAEGDSATTEQYKNKVAELRRAAEIEARVSMKLKFIITPDEQTETRLREETSKEVQHPQVNLQQDIHTEQQKDIQRTINSYALRLTLQEKAAKVAELDRTHQLETRLSEYDKRIAKLDGSKDAPADKDYLVRLRKCSTHNETTLRESLVLMTESPVVGLPVEQKKILEDLIIARALAITDAVQHRRPISDILLHPASLDLTALKATESYASTVDVNSTPEARKIALAQLEVGIKTHVVADQVFATGVSIRDVLNVQIINTFSPVVESDPNAINGVLSLAQATGRCVRHSDVKGRVQQFIDDRYKNIALITTVDEVIHPSESAAKIKVIMNARENHKAFMSDLFDQLSMIRNNPMFTKKSPPISMRITQFNKVLSTQEAAFNDQKNYLATTQAKLRHAEAVFGLVPGNKMGPVPLAYRNNTEMAALWTARKTLPLLIKTIEKDLNKIGRRIQETKQALANEEAEGRQLVQQVRATYPSEQPVTPRSPARPHYKDVIRKNKSMLGSKMADAPEILKQLNALLTKTTQFLEENQAAFDLAKDSVFLLCQDGNSASTPELRVVIEEQLAIMQELPNVILKLTDACKKIEQQIDDLKRTEPGIDSSSPKT